MMTIAQALLALTSLLAVAGCGLYGDDSGASTADVRGNIADTFPDRGDRDIVVFVYRVKDPVDDCEEPEFPVEDDGSQNVVLSGEDGETEFEVRNIPADGGRLVVVFLLDEAGDDADGRIDPGDPIAVLNDPDCVLDEVPNKSIVEAEDVEINFSDDDEPGFPDAGRAEADSITEVPE